MKSETRIVIADDHPIFRKGLKETIEAEHGLVVVAEAGRGDEALEAIEALGPDIAVLDVDMPGMDGLDVVRELRRRKVAVEIVILTIHSDEGLLDAALRLGVKGYVLKDSASTDIVTAIDGLRHGHHFTSPSLTTHLVNRAARGGALGDEAASMRDLTPAERPLLIPSRAFKSVVETMSH